jgi:hypothetical protein
MNKYNIEGGINFFDELYKSLDVEDDLEDDNNLCLITNNPLTEKYIELECKHKFNYIPLYNDLVNHKNKFNNLEATNGKLKLQEIRCPYCRNKQTNILPYYEEFGLKKINGVNYYDPNENVNNYHYCGNKCEYLISNESFDSTKLESNINKKYYECSNYFGTKITIYNKLNPSQPITYEDNMCYCYSHKKSMIKKYKEQEKEKEKELKELAKQEKVSAKLEKEKEKQLLKEQKVLSKKKQINNENIVLGPSQVSTSLEPNNLLPLDGCVQILKTGPNKGNQCCSKINGYNLCGRRVQCRGRSL